MITKEELFTMAERHKSGINRDRMVKALAREVALRANLYPRKMLEGRMKEADAIDELAAMMALLDMVVTIRDAPAVAARALITQQP